MDITIRDQNHYFSHICSATNRAVRDWIVNPIIIVILFTFWVRNLYSLRSNYFFFSYYWNQKNDSDETYTYWNPCLKEIVLAERDLIEERKYIRACTGQGLATLWIGIVSASLLSLWSMGHADRPILSTHR
jgi:hypothetical protein